MPSNDSMPVPSWFKFFMPIIPCYLSRMIDPTRRDDNELLGSWVAFLGMRGGVQIIDEFWVVVNCSMVTDVFKARETS